MNRLRAIGLSMVTALMVSAAIGAAPASAGFAAFEGKESVEATVSGKAPLNISWSYMTDSCAGYLEAGAALPPLDGVAGPIRGEQWSPYNCEDGEMDTNGCRLAFHTSKGESGGEFPGTLDIGGPECSGGIDFQISSLGACDLSIPPQSDLPVTFRNIEGLADKVEVDLGYLALEAIGDGGPGYNCPKGATTVHWTGEWTLEAEGIGGEAVDLRALEGEHSLYLEGGEFHAIDYPTGVWADMGGGLSMKAGRFSIVCDTAKLTAELSEASPTLSPVAGSYSGCHANSNQFTASIGMDGCDYGIGSSLSVSCGEEGDAITINLYESGVPFCTVEIGPQTSSTKLSFTNTTQGVSVAFNESAFMAKYTPHEGGLFAKCGVFATESKAKYIGSTVLDLVY